MPSLHSFPEKFKLVNDQVAEVRLYYPLSKEEMDPAVQALEDKLVAEGTFHPEWRFYEFNITLRDGRSFGFHAFTPELIRENLDTDGELAFICSGLVVVSEITVEALLEALEQSLEKAKSWGLEHFGYRIELTEDEMDTNGDENLDEAYRQMSFDQEQEAEAFEWIEGTIGDVAEEP